MTFNQFKKKNDNTKVIPLVEDTQQDQFSLLQNKFLQFVKYYDDIVEYEIKLNSLTRKEYDRIKDDM